MTTEKDESMGKEEIKAIADIVKAVPVYEDAIQPAAKELGKSLTLVAKAINVALAPIKLLVWGYDKIEGYLNESLEQKLAHVPVEDIIPAPLNIAGPAIEALRFSGHDECLRDLYANLLAAAMDRNTTDKAHPGFVEIIKNLSPDEAVLLKQFANGKSYPLIEVRAKGEKGFISILHNHTHLNKHLPNQKSYTKVPVYIENLIRLGILRTPYDIYLVAENIYEELENDEFVEEARKRGAEKGYEITLKRGIVEPTEFGEEFINAVVVEKS